MEKNYSIHIVKCKKITIIVMEAKSYARESQIQELQILR